MKYKYLYCNAGFFKEAFAAKFNLEIWNKAEPVPFITFGCYQSQWAMVLQSKQRRTCIWIGSDILQLEKNPEYIRKFKQAANIRHIAISRKISEKLHKYAIKHRVIPITPFNVKYHSVLLTPKTERKHVYVYDGERDLYRVKQSVAAIEKAGFKAIVCNKNAYENPDDLLANVYSRCFMGVRLTKNDGIPNTVCELGQLGLRCIHNSELPNAIHYDDDGGFSTDKIAKQIQQEWEREEDLQRVRDEMLEFLDVPLDWLNIDGSRTSSLSIDQKPRVTVIVNRTGKSDELTEKTTKMLREQQDVLIEIIEMDHVEDYAESLNKAFERASGNYISFLNAGDEPYLDKMITEIRMLKNHGKKCVYSSFRRCDKDMNQKSTKLARPYSLEKHRVSNIVPYGATVETGAMREVMPIDKKYGNQALWAVMLKIAEKYPDSFINNEEVTWRLCGQAPPVHAKMITEDYEGKQTMDVVDFVWVYVNDDNDVIKDINYSVASVKKFFQGKCRLFVVGDNPHIQGVEHISHKRVKGHQYAKANDSIQKLKKVCATSKIQGEFVYMSDDYVFIDKFSIRDLKVLRAHDYVTDENMYFSKRGKLPSGSWITIFNNTFRTLMSRDLSCWNAEIHQPRVFEKKKVREVLRKFDFEHLPMLFNSVYFNYHHGNPDVVISQDKFSLGAYFPMDIDVIKRKSGGYKMINYNEAGRNKDMLTFIKQKLHA